MIGYYVHHQGRGHLHRATSLCRTLRASGETVTGLSSLPEPPGWEGEWRQLDRDDDGEPACPTAGGRLHWAPLRHPGLRSRMAAISSWIEAHDPAALVVDVSVEVLLLARLHGVPTVGVVLPGQREDPAHRLAFDVADELIGFWPPEAVGMLGGVPERHRRRLRTVGALSRHDVVAPRPPGAGRDVLLMAGSGGHALGADDVRSAREQTPGWSWTVLGGDLGDWVEDPSGTLRATDVAVIHGGQNAVAEVAAARRPAIVVPQERPFAEQRTTARVLAELALPVVAVEEWPREGWHDLLAAAAGLDGAAWARWCDGGAAARFAQVVARAAGTR